MYDLTKIEEILLIAIVKLGEDAYGVKIRQHVSEMIHRQFTYGNLYSALNQLVQKKYVDRLTGESSIERRGRPKIYYSLSKEGLKALKESREMNQALWDGVPDYVFHRS